MSSCEGCFNGCTNIVSDRCVKYTGAPITQWDIDTGAPLSEVEDKIFSYLITVLSGTGIEPVIPSQNLCALISQWLPSGDVNLVNILIALSTAVCDLQSQINVIDGQITALEADYTVSCLSGVTASSGTHAILQATITKLCDVYNSVLTLQSNLNGYVKKTDLDARIQAYLDTLGSDKMYTKMVPYVAVEYYNDLSGYPTAPNDFFDATGAGHGVWEYVYLCNGLNGTPNKKGRIPIGCTSMLGPEDPIVTPGGGNPTYNDYGDTQGSNTVTLGIANMPSHNHLATSEVTDLGHRHLFVSDVNAAAGGSYEIYTPTTPSGNFGFDSFVNPYLRHLYTKSVNNQADQEYQTTGITVETVVQAKGSGLAHSNIPPVMACYYIMYIPPS